MKKISIDGLRQKAWDTFSIFIRLRDRKCVTCNARFWDEDLGEFGIKGLQAGHFKHSVLDFDEININAQCEQCNHFRSGNLSEYSVYLVNKYGADELLALDRRAMLALRGVKLSREDCEAIIEKYKKKIDAIRNKNSIFS